jgi:hypothetical protein
MSFKVRLLILLLLLLVATVVFATLRQTRIGLKTNSEMKDEATVNVHREAPQAKQKDAKQDLTTSPSGNLMAYYRPFDPYDPKARPFTVTIADPKQHKTISNIPVRWPARYVSSLDWLDDRYLMVRGEAAFLAIIDTTIQKPTHTLIAYDVSVSPDRTMMAYRYDFNPIRGYIPPAQQSDYVFVTLVERSPNSTSSNNNFKVIYPQPLKWGEAKPELFTDLNVRHQLRSDLKWSPSRHLLAFSEYNQQHLWLIVLRLKMVDSDIAVEPVRFDLGPADEAKVDVLWETNARIRVQSEKISSVFDIPVKD